MDTELVTRAQGGDQEAFADLVYAVADRFLAVSHRILSDIGLAEDATQQALLGIWQHLPQLRDPARFEAWSYRLLVRACYAEGRKSRRWAPNLRLLSVDEPMVERLDELMALAADDALPLRVDAYLALNYGDEFFGDWYADRAPGPVGDRLRVQGLKIHLDDGAGEVINWERADLIQTIGRADAAGWQVAVHAVSTEAQDLVLDAFEAAIGPNGPNPLHHRIEHAIEVSDEQLARMVAMDLVTVIHPDGVAGDWVQWNDYMGQGAAYPTDRIGWLGRWRDFVDAGLHVAAASDAPWFFPDSVLADDVGRPVDHIAGGMDGRGREFPQTPEWVLEQVLTADQGLQASTIGAAYALRDELRRGHLAPGTVGDVTILSGDVTDATPDELRAMSVVATIVGGSVAYCDDTEACASPSRD